MHAAPQVGSILLGKYRVEKVLGQGGMGFVVAARHEQLGELFAIKMMLPEALVHKDARERFMREARAVARMKGEHVTRVHDVGALENGLPYMVMEHLTGDDLQGVLDKRGALPLGEAALYVYQACEAVAEAHALGIVHRDLKPANMFLTRRPNETPCVKVLDFGISKDLDPNKVGPALTKTGTFVGTPMYMAPEQMANNKATDARSDIWSLGIILYELATGTVPFPADSMTELVTQVLTNFPAPPSHARPGIPWEFDAVVLRCLEKKPDQRFASVRELMAALHPFVGGNVSQTLAGVPDPRGSRPSIPEPRGSRPSIPEPRGSRPSDLGTAMLQRPTPPPQPMTQVAPFPPATPYTQAAQYASTVSMSAHDEAVAQARAQALSMPSTMPGQTNGAWGGTGQTSSGARGKTGLVAGLAVGVSVVLGLTGYFVTRPAASGNASVVPSATSPESVAPIVSTRATVTSPPPVESAESAVKEAVGKPQDKVRAIPSALVSATNVLPTKPPITKPPTSKVPDF